MNKKHRIALILAVVLLMYGCKDNVRETGKNNINIDSENSETAEKKIPKNSQDLINYLNKEIQNLDKEKAEELIFDLEDVLSENLSVATNIVMQKDIQNYLLENYDNMLIKRDAISNISDDKIKTEIKKIYDSGYIIQKVGNNYMPIINYGIFLTFCDELDEPYKSYFEIKNDDLTRPVLASGKLLSEPEQILEKLNNIEKFIKKNPSFTGNSDFLVRYQSWLYLILNGTPLDPIVNQDGKLDDRYQIMLDKAVDKKTITDTAVSKAFKILQKNSYQFDDKVNASIRSIVKNNTEYLRAISSKEEEN
ncbi:MAG: hypothetical protein MSH08_00970 [Ezakiella sp.]|nr:hypothetical protein [Ezakiella sp.]MDD7471330.1 hypothetical protein [Bacillota bacterium]MDY3923575.1 hypothetical protein [Ezakiella sp.]